MCKNDTSPYFAILYGEIYDRLVKDSLRNFCLIFLYLIFANLNPFAADAQQRDSTQNGSVAPAGSPVVCAGVDDTSRIQAALDAAGQIEISGNCVISGHLIYHSNSTIDLTQATIRYNQSVADWLLVNAAGMSTNETPLGWGAQRTFSDAITTSGSTTIHSATANFTNADLKQSIDCLTAAGAGAGLDLHTRIAAINSPTAVTVDDAAGVTLVDTTCSIFTRDSNVTITGGTLIVTGSLVPATSYPMVKAKTINNIVIQNMNLQEPGLTGMYHLVFQDISGFSASNINVQSIFRLQDGIDVIGPAREGTETNISGYTGDDFVAITTSYVGQLIDSSTYGTITDISLQNIHGASLENNGGVRLFLRAPGNINGIKLDDLHGDTVQVGGSIYPGIYYGFGNGVKVDYSSADPGTPGSVNQLFAENISGWFQYSAFILGTPTINNPTIENLFDNNPKCGPEFYLVEVGNSSTVNNLDLQNPANDRSSCAAILGVAPGSKVTFSPNMIPEEQN
jgi:hypothetical protein